jgi:Sulfatase
MALPDDRHTANAGMMGKVSRLHPFLFVIIPVLNVLSRNPGGATLRDAAGLAVAIVLAWALVYAAATFALRHRREREAVPLLVLLAVVLFYAYPVFRAAYNQAGGEIGRLMLPGAAAFAVVVAALGGIRWLSQRPAPLSRANSFFAMMGLLLVAFLGARVSAAQLRSRSQLRSSSLVSRLEQPIRAKNNPAKRTERLPNIYIVILDEYANSNVLRERFGFDNRGFEDSLRSLGFTIPRSVRSNYVHTVLSLPSLLNFSYLTDLEQELGSRETDPTLPNHLVQHNRTVAFLKDRGYRFAFFPSQWWISTERNRHADTQFRAWRGVHLGRAATRSDLRRVYVSRTPLALLHHGDRHDADYVKRTLASLAQLPSDTEPTFTLAHVLNPHYPYVFDANCNPLGTRPARRWGHGREDDYVKQLTCLNHLVLGTVTQLLQRSRTEPIIVLVGDHGTNSLGYNRASSAEAVSPEQARERLGAFGAFRFPAGGALSVPDSITLVNVVPTILNSYFDAGIPLLPDSLFMSLEETPYLFVPLDPFLLTPLHHNRM